MQLHTRVLLTVGPTVLAAAGVLAAADKTPFVIGFERFHRQQQPHAIAGDLLIGELSCAACHRSDEQPPATAKLGPRLAGVSHRVSRQWLESFLQDPQSVRPGSTMPRMVSGTAEEKRRAVAALVAFLATLSDKGQFDYVSTAGDPAVPEFWNKGDRLRGQALYHQVGCVACHAPDPDYGAATLQRTDRQKKIEELKLTPDEAAELGLVESTPPAPSIPRGDLAGKYDRRSLTFFLLNPLHTRPAGRMPHFGLTKEESADIAAHLIPAKPTPSVNQPDAPLAQRGKELFVSLGCANCHAVEGVKSPAAKPLDRLPAAETPSCLSKQPSPALPHYALDRDQLAAIDAALAAHRSKPRVPTNRHQRLHAKMLQMNCYACHESNKRGGVGPERWRFFETVGHVDMGDEGRIPPALDGVGSKLKPDWIAKALDGAKVRPHMRARMPNFGEQVDVMAELFTGGAKKDAQLSPPKLAPPAAGAKLLGAGCVQCHPLRGEALPGVVGVDVANIGDRVRADWFRQFLLNPAELKRNTRMPTFFLNGKSPSHEILAGDVDLQISAIWNYLNTIEKHDLPEKLAEGKVHNFVLTPRAEPIVLRTFMAEAGTHAIAVGFPQELHYSFDADRARVAQLWKGSFINAHATWFNRFVPPVKPLGSDVVQLPLGQIVAPLKDGRAAWPTAASPDAFQGYRLDKRRVPTLLYRVGRLQIADRTEPSADGKGLARRIEISPRDATAQRIWIRPLTGKRLTVDAARGKQLRAKSERLRVHVALPQAANSSIRESDNGQERIAPVEVSAPISIHLLYQW